MPGENNKHWLTWCVGDIRHIYKEKTSLFIIDKYSDIISYTCVFAGIDSWYLIWYNINILYHTYSVNIWSLLITVAFPSLTLVISVHSSSASPNVPRKTVLNQNLLVTESGIRPASSVPAFQPPDSGSNTSSCNSSTPSSPAFHFSNMDTSSSSPAHPSPRINIQSFQFPGIFFFSYSQGFSFVNISRGKEKNIKMLTCPPGGACVAQR